MDETKRFLSSNEVIEQLAINKATLYSYVSRGLIRSEENVGKTRNRRYLAEDVAALLKRKEDRRNPERVAESALQWGDPVLESEITLIENNRLYYRGFEAQELAQTQNFEQVAALLWNLSSDSEQLFVEAATTVKAWLPFVDLPTSELRLRSLDRFQIALPIAASLDLAAYDFSAEAVAKCGARILQLLTALASHSADPSTIAQQLQRAWSADNEALTQLLNSALILCADHELNASSFTARCAASAGSTVYAVVNAGLSALQGYRHGGHTERVEALFREAIEDPQQAILNRLKRGEEIPGFGHQLYPDGDPRARFLLRKIEAANPASPTFETAMRIIESVGKTVQRKPNIDFALVTLTQSCALPPGSPLTLFALGRIAGWIGHAIEQYKSNQLIRPRARYKGKQPVL